MKFELDYHLEFADLKNRVQDEITYQKIWIAFHEVVIPYLQNNIDKSFGEKAKKDLRVIAPASVANIPEASFKYVSDHDGQGTVTIVQKLKAISGPSYNRRDTRELCFFLVNREGFDRDHKGYIREAQVKQLKESLERLRARLAELEALTDARLKKLVVGWNKGRAMMRDAYHDAEDLGIKYYLD